MLRVAASTALVLAALVLVALTPAGASAGSGTEKCGKHIVNGGGWWNLRAERTSCKSARKLADYFVFEAGGVDIGFNPRYHDWVCLKIRTADEIWRVQCSNSKSEKDKMVRFLYGA